MSEPKFTKGPWRVGPCGGVYPLGKGSMIASADTKSGYLPNHENNEILIAAAPDLYEAVRKAIQLSSIASDWNLGEVEIDGKMVETDDLRDEFEAAFSKAAGVK